MRLYVSMAGLMAVGAAAKIVVIQVGDPTATNTADKLKFIPEVTLVDVQDTVRFTFMGAHSVTQQETFNQCAAGAPRGSTPFDSGVMMKGQSFDLPASAMAPGGVVNFYCKVNQGAHCRVPNFMQGSVVVNDSGFSQNGTVDAGSSQTSTSRTGDAGSSQTSTSRTGDAGATTIAVDAGSSQTSTSRTGDAGSSQTATSRTGDAGSSQTTTSRTGDAGSSQTSSSRTGDVGSSQTTTSRTGDVGSSQTATTTAGDAGSSQTATTIVGDAGSSQNATSRTGDAGSAQTGTTKAGDAGSTKTTTTATGDSGTVGTGTTATDATRTAPTASPGATTTAATTKGKRGKGGKGGKAGKAATVNVSVGKDGKNQFSPSTIQASAGDSIVFTWSGARMHNIVPSDQPQTCVRSAQAETDPIKKALASGAPQLTGKKVFKVPTTVKVGDQISFYCAVGTHCSADKMYGTIMIVAPGTAKASAPPAPAAGSAPGAPAAPPVVNPSTASGSRAGGASAAATALAVILPAAAAMLRLA